ncbi:MAG: hypothetical protein AB7Q42_21055 [Acidimicrobiia bacterium]
MSTAAPQRQHRPRRSRRASLVVGAGLTIALASIGAAAQVSASTTPSNPIGATGFTAPKLRIPSAPLVLEQGRFRPANRSELDRLSAGRSAQGAPNCIVDFDDDAAVQLVGGAHDTFVYSPWWNQECGDSWVRVYPTNINHYHLTYADPDVTVCLNPSNEYGTPVGLIARDAQECEPIDPVTEPRGFLHSMFANDIIEIGRIDLYGGNYTPRPFTFERIKVVNAGVRVCFQLEPDGPWEAAEPPGPGDHPAQYCWPSLGTGTWDLSNYTSGAIRVTVTSDGDGSANFGIDNLHLDW